MAEPWIATKPIYLGTALGYAPGDVVPDQVVKDHDLSGSVSRASSKAAAEAQG